MCQVDLISERINSIENRSIDLINDRMDVLINEWMNGSMYVLINEWVEELIEWMDKWVEQ